MGIDGGIASSRSTVRLDRPWIRTPSPFLFYFSGFSLLEAFSDNLIIGRIHQGGKEL